MIKQLSLFSALCLGVFTFASQSFAQNAVTDWNEVALDTVRDEGLAFTDAARLYALVNIAMYDAVNGIDVADGESSRDFAAVPPDNAPEDANRVAAAVAAGHAVLSALFPSHAAIYDAQRDSDLVALTYEDDDAEEVDAGVAFGAFVGQELVALRANDGSSPSVILPGGTEPGVFRRDFGAAQFAELAPFGIANPDVYRSPGPPALDSFAYAVAVNEVQVLGDGAMFNQTFEELFRFWRGGGGSARPPGEWIKIAIVVTTQENVSLSESAQLFALLGMAMGDSAIVATDSKVAFHFWRPATAIREANTDGNSYTVQDTGWNPRNGGTGGSPEHTSGQSTFAGAGSTILAGFFGTDEITFTFEGDDAIAGPRTFTSFSSAAAEAGRARIFAGIHFEFSNQAGQAAGRGLANEILDTRLLPLDDDDNDDDDDDDDD